MIRLFLPRRSIVVLLIAVGLSLTGCGGSFATVSDSSSSNPVPSTPPEDIITLEAKTYFLGDLDGVLAPALEQALVSSQLYSGQETDAAILLDGDQIGRLSEAEKAGILATYLNNKSIVLLQATPDQIRALLAIIGVNAHYSLPEGLPEGKAYAEIFAIDAETSGDIFTYEVVPPGDFVDEENNLSWTDNPDSQLKRAHTFVNWLADDGVRQVSGPDGEVSNSNDLRNLAQAQVTTKVFTTARGNIFQLTNLVYACHSFNAADGVDYDWFYVQQNGILNYAPSYLGKREHYRQGSAGAYYYGGSIELDNWFPGQDRANGLPTVVRASPENANSVTRVTSGVTWSFGGQVGFKGSEPMGGVSGGVSINHSESFEVADCTVTNTAISRFTNAAWTYDFKRAELIPYIYYAGLTDPPRLSVTQFQPVNQWIWKVPPALRASAAGASFQTALRPTLVFSLGGTVKGPWVIDGPHHVQYPWSFAFSTPLIYPPLIVGPANVDFGSAAGFKPVDVAVARPWNVSSDQAWCTVSPTSGPADNGRTYVTVEQNTTGADRTATLTFKTADGQGETRTKVFQSRI